MKKFNWNSLEIKDSDGDHPAVAALCAFFYFGKEDIHSNAEEIGNAIEKYVNYVGINSLTTYLATSGRWKEMTKRVLNKDLKLLRDFPPDYEMLKIEYEAGEGGEPGPFGVYAFGRQKTSLWGELTSHLRFSFPVDWLESHEIDEFIDFIVGIVEMKHIQSANVGYALKSTTGSSDEAIYDIQKKIPRYLGLDPCYIDTCYHMLGHIFTAHWLNYLDEDLAGKLGGSDAIIESLPDCDVRQLSKGVLICGAKSPPIGDSNRKAPDIGCLPDVARVLKPLRLDVSEIGFVDEEENFDAVAWIERLDNLDARPWDNT